MATAAAATGSPPPREPVASLFRVNSLATLTAPVTARTRTAAFRTSQSVRSYAPSPARSRIPRAPAFGSASVTGNYEIEEEKFPLPDKVDVWARYGFLDDDKYLYSSSEGESDTPDSSGGGAGEAGTSAGGDRWRQTTGVLAQNQQRDYPAHGSSEPARIVAARGPAAATAAAGGGGAAAPTAARATGLLSPELGTSTPPTVILTPSSQERCRRNGGVPGTSGAPACNATAAGLPPNARFRPRRGDSLADSLAASAANGAAAAASRAAAEAAMAATENQETKDEELMALRRGEQEQLLAAEQSSDAGSSRSSSSSGYGSKATRRPPPTMAEVERHKRNRAERLRAYGCQRTLYPRIVPGGTDGGASAGGSGSSVTEEMETEEWVNTLRVSASLRGESLMAACTQSFAQDRAATLLGDKQSEARASRTADVSQMEGPDGLLHCSVLKGDHALAARAAQFLVDKKGANVNSRDQWGRTPLHTASGKGMVAMARFFIRRGANVDALDQDNRTPLFFACSSGNTTVVRYLTRIEVGARMDLRDARGKLAGEYFWSTVEPATRDEILAILSAAGWPDPPAPRRESTGQSRCGKALGVAAALPRSRGAPPSKNSSSRRSSGGSGSGGGEGGGEPGMMRLASDMMFLMKRR